MNFNESDGERYRESEEVVICPYDESHRILPHRFALHVVRCARRHPHIKLDRCIYNSTHFLKKSKMEAHLLVCEDKAKYDALDVLRGKDPLAEVQGAAAQDEKTQTAAWQEHCNPKVGSPEASSPAVGSPEASTSAVRSPEASSAVGSPGALSPTVRYLCDEGQHFDEDNPRYRVGSSATSSPLRAGARDTPITHANYSPGALSRSTGDRNVPNTGDFSYFSRSQFSPGSNYRRSDLPIPLANESNIPVQSAQAQSFWSYTPVAAASGQATSMIPSDYGAHAVSASGINTAGSAVSVRSKVSAAVSAVEVCKVKPAERRYIIKRKRFLEKKLHGIEKLESRLAAGQALTEEEKIKIEKKEEYEEQLISIITGINLDD